MPGNDCHRRGRARPAAEDGPRSANVVGAVSPVFSRRIGVHPNVTSGPFIVSLMDIPAILMYFYVAAAILRAARREAPAFTPP